MTRILWQSCRKATIGDPRVKPRVKVAPLQSRTATSHARCCMGTKDRAQLFATRFFGFSHEILVRRNLTRNQQAASHFWSHLASHARSCVSISHGNKPRQIAFAHHQSRAATSGARFAPLDGHASRAPSPPYGRRPPPSVRHSVVCVKKPLQGCFHTHSFMPPLSRCHGLTRGAFRLLSHAHGDRTPLVEGGARMPRRSVSVYVCVSCEKPGFGFFLGPHKTSSLY